MSHSHSNSHFRASRVPGESLACLENWLRLNNQRHVQEISELLEFARQLRLVLDSAEGKVRWQVLELEASFCQLALVLHIIPDPLVC